MIVVITDTYVNSYGLYIKIEYGISLERGVFRLFHVINIDLGTHKSIFGDFNLIVPIFSRF